MYAGSADFDRHRVYLEKEMKRSEYINSCKKYGDRVRNKILRYIAEYVDLHGYPPSYREIGAGVGLRGLSSVHHHMMELFDRGELETDLEDRFSTSRAYRIARGKHE